MWHDSFICVTWRIYAHTHTHTHIIAFVASCIRNAFICVTWLVRVAWLIRRIHRCNMTYSYVWHDSCTCVTWLMTRTRAITHSSYSHMWHDSCICVTKLIQMRGMTHSCVCHDPLIVFTCVIWLIRMCDMTHSYVWQDSIICVTWPIQTHTSSPLSKAA